MNAGVVVNVPEVVVVVSAQNDVEIIIVIVVTPGQPSGGYRRQACKRIRESAAVVLIQGADILILCVPVAAADCQVEVAIPVIVSPCEVGPVDVRNAGTHRRELCTGWKRNDAHR